MRQGAADLWNMEASLVRAYAKSLSTIVNRERPDPLDPRNEDR
jgi:hypothetical protein